jgi:hypothetical protein
VKHRSLLLFFCSSAVLIGSALPQTGPPPIPPGPLGDINTAFLNEYVARMNAITKVHPLYIEVSGNNLILHRKGQEESKRVIPDIYHSLKDVSHVPFLVYLRLSPLSSNEQFSETEIKRLETLSTQISAARDSLSTGDFNAIQMKLQKRIRVIYSEFLHPHRDSAELLASVLIDADTATAFFGNRWGLSEDLLGDAAGRCIARLPRRDRTWHR